MSIIPQLINQLEDKIMPEEVWRPLDLLVPPHDSPKVNLRDLGYEISSKKGGLIVS
jgi:hypothetical protein